MKKKYIYILLGIILLIIETNTAYAADVCSYELSDKDASNYGVKSFSYGKKSNTVNIVYDDGTSQQIKTSGMQLIESGSKNGKNISISGDAVKAVNESSTCPSSMKIIEYEGKITFDIHDGMNYVQQSNMTLTANSADSTVCKEKTKATINGVTLIFGMVEGTNDYCITASSSAGTFTEKVNMSGDIWITQGTIQFEGRQDRLRFNTSEIPKIWDTANFNMCSYEGTLLITGSNESCNGNEVKAGKLIIRPIDDPTYEGDEINFLEICNDNVKVRRVARLIGYLLIAVKVVVPLGIIIFGAITFGQALTSGDDDALMKNIKKFAIKIIASLVIFMLPTLTNLALSLVDDKDEGTETFHKCRTCILEPKNCDVK